MTLEASALTALAMLLGNAFFVGAEFGLVSARRSSIELRALNGSRAAKVTLDAMEHVSLMLAGAQLGITLCSLVLGAVGEPLFAHLLEGPFHALGIADAWLHPLALALALALMVYLHVVIGEMVPKNLALANPDRTALVLTPPLALIVRLVRPLVLALNAVSVWMLKLIGVKPQPEIASSFTRDEVAGFVKESRREGLLTEDEEHLLSGALEFDERTVQSVLLPLKNLTTASSQATPDELEKVAAQTGYSRIPVTDKRKRLAGYVHLKDLLGVADNKHAEPIPAHIIRPLVSVSARTSLRAGLSKMQNANSHMAQVTGRGGEILGVATLEDVLEELVGEIRDDSQKGA